MQNIKIILARVGNGELLRANRDKVAFGVSLILLSIVMSVWWEMFRFSKELRVPGWSRGIPYPFLLPYYMVTVGLIPATFIASSFRSSCVFVLLCVLISSVFPSIRVMMSAAYHPLGNGLLSYMFVVIWICMLPSCLLVFMKVIGVLLVRIKNHI